jgi:hypothetical protein
LGFNTILNWDHLDAGKNRDQASGNFRKLSNSNSGCIVYGCLSLPRKQVARQNSAGHLIACHSIDR